MNAEIIAKALDGCRDGVGSMAHCPAPDDHTPSLSVRDSTNGKVLLRCHSSCEQERVIAALRMPGIGRKRLVAASDLRDLVERLPVVETRQAT